MEKEGYQTTMHILRDENESQKRKSLDVISCFNENHQTSNENSQDCEYEETSDKLFHKHLSSDSSFDRAISINKQEISETCGISLDSKLAVDGCSTKDDEDAPTFCSLRWCSNFVCIISCFALIEHLVVFYGRFGSISFQVFGVILYIVDVVTDIISGADLISGTEIDYSILGKEGYENYTRNVCNDLLNHSHRMWGSINIGFAWFPAIISITSLVFHWRFITNSEDTIHWTKKVSVILIMGIFWPFIGLML